MLDVFLDALIDSLKVLGFAFVLFVVFSFFETKISAFLTKHQKTQPLVGSSCGLIPQCGISVVAADLYVKEHITMGTLLAIFFACSDEALPILLTGGNKSLYVIPLLLIKFVFGFILGFVVDLIIKKEKTLKEEVIEEDEETKIERHLLHPLIHSLKIFIYVLIINFILGTIIFYVTEESLINFLNYSYYATPILAVMVGLIPNCASSATMSELFLLGGLPFGALVSGLCVNAGLGIIYLLKSQKKKDVLKITLILIGYSLIVGYLTFFIMEVI